MSDIYLDHNATTPALQDAVLAMTEVLHAGPTNPSSDHAAGRRARKWLGEAREQVAGLVGAPAEAVRFVSSATEANHLVLSNLLAGPMQGLRLVTTPVEHSSIRNALPVLAARGVEVVQVAVSDSGLVDLSELVSSLVPDRTLVSIQWANNETGVVQPIEAIAELCRAAGALLHVDAVQAVGKMRVDLTQIPIDFAVFSSHKLNGPLGAAALVSGRGARLAPVLPGGQQEGGVRPGTENLPAIVGFGAACSYRKAVLDDWIASVRGLRDQFERLLESSAMSVLINGRGSLRLPNTSNVRFVGVDGEALVLRAQARGLACSQGSACNSQKPEPSHVLRAMGLSEEAAWGSVRFSFGGTNTTDEVTRAVTMLEKIHSQLTGFPLLARVV